MSIMAFPLIHKARKSNLATKFSNLPGFFTVSYASIIIIKNALYSNSRKSPNYIHVWQ